MATFFLYDSTSCSRDFGSTVCVFIGYYCTHSLLKRQLGRDSVAVILFFSLCGGGKGYLLEIIMIMYDFFFAPATHT